MGKEKKQNENPDQTAYPLIEKPPQYDSIVQPIQMQPSAPMIPVEVPNQQSYAPGHEPIRTQPIVITNVSPQAGPQPSGNFQYDLFDCCGDMVSCCCSFFCPSLVASQIATKINRNDFCGCCGCCACLGVFFLGGFAVTCLRCDFRKTQKIKGGCCADCITSICCTTCALTQMHREAQKI